MPAEREPCGAQLLSNIPVYRWLCFAATLVPAGYAAVLAVKAALWVLEDKYFLTSNIVFHIIAVRVRRCLLREVLHHRICQVVLLPCSFKLSAQYMFGLVFRLQMGWPCDIGGNNASLEPFRECAQREVRNVLAATLVTLIYSVFFWEYGHSDPASNPEYWVLVKVRAGAPLCTPNTEQCGRLLCLLKTNIASSCCHIWVVIHGSVSVLSVL